MWAMYCLPCLKPSVTHSFRSAISTRAISTGFLHQRQVKHYLSQHRSIRQVSSSSLSSTNIIYSRHEDCFLHNKTVVQQFFDRVSLWPDLVALECGLTGRSYTYGKLRDLIRRFGSALVRQGFKRGDVLGMVLPNLPETPIILLGASGIGMPVTAVNPVYTCEEIARQLENAGATVVVTVPQMSKTMLQVRQLCPKIRHLIIFGEQQEGFASLTEMFHDPGDLFDDNIEIDPINDIFVLPYSSGTTGLPKGVMLTHSNVSANIQQLGHPGTMLVTRATPGNNVTDFHQDVYICVLPFFHMYGMLAILLTGMDHGAKLLVLPNFESKSFINCLNQHRPTILHLVPPLVAFLGQCPDLKLEVFHRLHTVVIGAAPLGPTAATKLIERLQKENLLLQEGYGMTETSCVTHFGPIVNNEIGSFGEPISRTKVKVLDLDTGNTLGPNQKGELCVSGPQVMKGYYKNQKATEETIDSDGWLHTGDMVYYNERKQFFVVDRLKELIKVKGLQVSPSELEDLLRRHPAVLDVAVIGIPDDFAGELPRAYIVKKSNVSVSKEDIINFIDTQVAPHKKLKGGIVFLDNIPKTNTGKLLRRELKNMTSPSS